MLTYLSPVKSTDIYLSAISQDILSINKVNLKIIFKSSPISPRCQRVSWHIQHDIHFLNSVGTMWHSLCTLLWRHNEHDSVSNHQPRGCLLNRLFRRRSKKTSKLRVTGLCVGKSPGPVNSPRKGPVTRKMFPFDDVIMKYLILVRRWNGPQRPGLILCRS